MKPDDFMVQFEANVPEVNIPIGNTSGQFASEKMVVDINLALKKIIQKMTLNENQKKRYFSSLSGKLFCYNYHTDAFLVSLKVFKMGTTKCPIIGLR